MNKTHSQLYKSLEMIKITNDEDILPTTHFSSSPKKSPRKNGWKMAVRMGYFCGLFISGCYNIYLPLILKNQGIDNTQIGWIFSIGAIVKMFGPLFGTFVSGRFLTLKSTILLCSLISSCFEVTPIILSILNVWSEITFCSLKNNSLVHETTTPMLNFTSSPYLNTTKDILNITFINSTYIDIPNISTAMPNISHLTSEQSNNSINTIISLSNMFWLTILSLSAANFLEYLIQSLLDSFTCHKMLSETNRKFVYLMISLIFSLASSFSDEESLERPIDNTNEMAYSCIKIYVCKPRPRPSTFNSLRSNNNAGRSKFGKFRMYGPIGYGSSILLTTIIPILYGFYCEDSLNTSWLYNVVLLFVIIFGQLMFALTVIFKLHIEPLNSYNFYTTKNRPNLNKIINQMDESEYLMKEPIMNHEPHNNTSQSIIKCSAFGRFNNFFLSNKSLFFDLFNHCLYCLSLSIGYVFMAILINEQNLSNTVIGITVLIGCCSDVFGMFTSSYFEKYINNWHYISSLCLLFHISRSFLIGFYPCYWTIFIYSTLSFMTYGIYRPLIVCRISQISRKDDLSTSISLITTFGCIGFSLGSVIGGYSIKYFGFNNTFYASGTLTLLLVIINLIKVQLKY